MPIPQRPDSTIVPDTTPERIVRADSIQAPFARAESPVLTDIGFRYAWDREAFFASGAITLLDLLERVPGLTGFRAGWTAAPMTASYLGVPGRVRIYLDGLELDALLGREGGMNDLVGIQLWQLEDVTIERGASEVRVFVRSWRHERTTPYTRTDIYTGDEESNSYRGYYGKRWRNGMGLQVAAQQWSVAARDDEGGAGDQLTLLSRIGWARGSWSVDGYIQQSTRNVGPLLDGTRFGTDEQLLATLEARERLAYLRAGWRRPELDGPWLQLIASAHRVTETGERITAASGRIPLDTIDTLASRPQYVAAAGYNWGGVRVSGTLRTRAGTGTGRALLSPAARLSWDRRWIGASFLAERVERVDDSTLTRLEAIARVSPFSWLSFAGAASRESGVRSLTGEGAGALDEPTQPNLRGEVGLRLRRTWLGGGVLRRTAAILPTPQLFYAGPAPEARADDALTGAFVSASGPIWRGVGIDAWGVRWDRADALYRPQFQSRAELYFRTNWLSRFPSGEFGFLFGAVHEYRSNVLFPAATGPELRSAPQVRTVGTILELRLQQAVLSWQVRNIQTRPFAYVPGFPAPKPINVYGVRWEFWN